MLWAHKVSGTSLMLTWSSSERFVWVCASDLTDLLVLGVHPLWHFFFSPLSVSVSPLLLPGCINRNRAPAFSLLDPESSYSFRSSGFSLLLQRAESSDELEQAETLGVNKAVDWRLLANSAASQLQEERLSPVFLSSLSGYFNFLPGFLWWWGVERKPTNICFLI